MILDDHCIAADDACAVTEVLAVPWLGVRMDDRGGYSHNSHLSLRIQVEQACGELVWRRPFCVPLVMRATLIRACLRLHIYCWD